VAKERSQMSRDIQNEVDWTQYGLKLHMGVTHNNKGVFQEALAKAQKYMKKKK
jgi:hypothetical protein